jgi:hypothetical protein
MSRRRRYSDEEKGEALAALDANAGNVKATARQLRIPRITLLGWAAGQAGPAVSELRHQIKGELADRLEGVAHALLDAMGSPDKIGAATLQQLAISLGIVIDKMLLLRARPFGENNHQSGPSRGTKGTVRSG